MKEDIKYTNATMPSHSEKTRLRLKVCGMTDKENISEVAALQPDFLGFIFYKESSRFFDGVIPPLPESIKKVGVFVDERVEVISDKIDKHTISVIQLHGHETPEICRLLKTTGADIVKVFSIKDTFDFSILKAYEDVCDYFLFDTKGKLPGGNGYAFNWELLKDYPSTKPYFLSGGIGMDDIESIKDFLQKPESQHCYAIDVNSKFEIEPGLKDVQQLKEFKTKLILSDV